MASTLAVIPTYALERVDGVARLVETLSGTSFTPLVVANSAATSIALRRARIHHLDAGMNLGFGAAVNQAAASVDGWDWLLIVNDDMTIPWEAARTIASVLAEVKAEGVVYFDPRPPKLIPTTVSAFLDLSLLNGVLLKARARRHSLDISTPSTYKSFSIVAISRAAWDALGGLDEALLFTYEDADFVRRAQDRDIPFTVSPAEQLHHEHSATGKLYIDEVLPVSAWSAYKYLEKWGSAPTVARLVCIAALILRIPLTLAIDTPVRLHLRGVARAIRTLATNRLPQMPAYDRE